jgi:hypothetical protein
MGVVYRATEVNLDRLVAIKLISDELARDDGFRERFQRESRLAASIRHPNVITVFRAGEEDGNLFIAMDYIEGTDLKELIRSRGVLEPLAAGRIAWQVGRALDAAHAKALVHRDVKPANVLMTEEGGEEHAYLTDFGLTKNVGSESGMTQTGVVVGTIDYMAPEQVAGAPVDGRVDIYSLGCVLWEALTGRVPYQRDSAVAKMYAHMHEPPPSLADAMPGLPAELGAVVARAMAKEPDERYLSAGDLGEAALAAAEGRVIDISERSVAIGAAAPASATKLAATAPAGTAPAATQAAASGPAAVTTGDRERRRTRRWPAVGAAAVAAVVAALVVLLSGGGDDGGGGAKPLSKDKYQDEVIDASQDLTHLAGRPERSGEGSEGGSGPYEAARHDRSLRQPAREHRRTQRHRERARGADRHGQAAAIRRRRRGCRGVVRGQRRIHDGSQEARARHGSDRQPRR